MVLATYYKHCISNELAFPADVVYQFQPNKYATDGVSGHCETGVLTYKIDESMQFVPLKTLFPPAALVVRY